MPIVFIYTGGHLPPYLKWNLRLARKNFSGEIFLLTDQSTHSPYCEIVDIRPWYDPSPFEQFCAASPLDPYFRRGFWLKAAERFFVLEQFMRHYQIDRVFQVESDVLVLNLEGFAVDLDAHGRGIFAPPESPEQAVASVMYVNDQEALGELCDFTINNAHIGNEMKILGHFMAANPEMGHALPCNHVLDPSWPFMPSTVSEHVGLVDATFLGMWVLGIDPRNVQSHVWNRYLPDLTTHNVTAMRLLPVPGGKKAVARLGDRRYPLRAIHIHSKAFRRLNVPGALPIALLLSNLPVRLPVVIKWAMVFHAVARLALRREPASLLRSAPAWAKGLIARTLIGSCERSPRQLSLRERRELISLLPRVASQGPQEITDVIVLSEGNSSQDLKNTLGGIEGVSSCAVIAASKPSQLKLWESGHVRFTQTRDALQPFMDDTLLARVLGDSDLSVQLAAIVTLHAATSDCVMVLSANPEESQGPRAPLTTRRFPLIVDSSKSTDALKLASEFFGDGTIERTWAYQEGKQLVSPRVIREMFPDLGNSLRQLSELALARGSRRVSVAQLYGSWVRQNYRRDTILLTDTSRNAVGQQSEGA